MLGIRMASTGLRLTIRVSTLAQNTAGEWLLSLRAGQSLDHESSASFVVAVTATDINGDPAGLSDTVNVTVNVNDVNEGPVAATAIGNWWVTVDKTLTESAVVAGEYLTFELENVPDGDANPAFTDPDGDALTYAITSGPAWLEFDPGDPSVIRNKAGMLPSASGVYDITVTATDPDSASASIDFKLAVALSAPGNADNHVPDVDPGDMVDYVEGSGRQRVATFRVEDDDRALNPHPYGDVDVTLDAPSTVHFELSDPIKSGNVWTYHVYAKADNALDHETHGPNWDIVVTATDGAGAASMRTIAVDIDDAPEAPAWMGPGGPSSTDLSAVAVNQSNAVQRVYLNLFELWEDPDARDDDADLIYTVVSNASWISVVVAPDQWSNVDQAANPWGVGLTTPAAGDMVAILEIDRAAAPDDAQAAEGSITLTAADSTGSPITQVVSFAVTDQNLPIPGQAVSISGSAREDGTLVAQFDHIQDPDLAAGARPEAVVYSWYTVTGVVETLVQHGQSNQLSLTQDHAGDQIRVKVTYVEVDPAGNFYTNAPAPETTATTAATVANVPDPGRAHIVLKTGGAGGTELQAEVTIVDEDGVPAAPPGAPEYTWEVSDNGVGNWSVADSADVTSDTVLNLGAAGGGGKFYRVVVTYTDSVGGAERIESETIQVGQLASQAAPGVTGAPSVGGTLIVDAGAGAVQWQRQVDPDGVPGNGDEYWVDIPGATGNLTLNASHAGMTFRALVTYTDANGATAVVATANQVVPAPANTAPVALSAPEVQLSADNLAGRDFHWALPLGSLFQDAEGDPLTVTLTAVTGLVHDGLLEMAGEPFDALTSAQQMVTFVRSTNALTYRAVEGFTQGHDGDPTDGAGNVVTLTFQAQDPGGLLVNNDVDFRISVEPTDVLGVVGLNVAETLAPLAADLFVTNLDVQDENDSTHAFGTHGISVSDSRFKIEDDIDGDGSTWNLVLKAGALIDYETETDDDTGMMGLQIAVDLTVTDGDGQVLMKTIMITINDDPADNPPAADPVPGLKDNEPGDPDETKDDGTDGDDDGGAGVGVAPGGGVFLAPAGAMDEDLLDSFVLAIDEVDIA